MQWRSILVVGVRCRIRAPKELQRIVRYGVKVGWLEARDGRTVALTGAGRKVGCDVVREPSCAQVCAPSRTFDPVVEQDAPGLFNFESVALPDHARPDDSPDGADSGWHGVGLAAIKEAGLGVSRR